MPIKLDITLGSRLLVCLLGLVVLLLGGLAVALGWLGESVLSWLIPAVAGVWGAYVSFRGIEKRGQRDA